MYTTNKRLLRWGAAPLLLLAFLVAGATAQPTFDSNLFDNGFSAISVRAGELTNDGWQDIVVATSGGEFYFYRSQGDGTFDQLDTQAIASGFNTIRTVAVGDVDGDGDTDVLGAIKDDDTIVWFENISDGDSWTTHIVDSNLDEAYDVVAVDIDDDGDTDLFAGGHADSGVICWYENDGSEVFTKHVIETTTATGGVYAISAGDINGDGSIDVAFASEGYPTSNDSEDMIAFYENDGSTNFGGSGFVIDGGYVGGHTAQMVDFDGDDDLDVLVASDDSDESARIAWYENDNGDASSWTQHLIYDIECKRAWAEDMDNDGDLDVVGASYTGGEFYWVENTGGALTWDLHVVQTGMSNAHRAFPFDMDNDGDNDIVACALSNSHGLYIAENEFTDPIPVAANEHIYYEGWTLMSVPYDLSGHPNQPSVVIGDDLADIAVWQLIGFNYDQGMYFEYQPGVTDNVVEVNHGYWLGIAHSDTNVVDVVGDAVSGDVTVDLEYPWNMLGYPFLDEGDIYDWQVIHDGDTYSMAAAADSGYVVPIIHVAAPEFTNWGYWYHFGATDEIRPWYGFWFLTLVDDLQLVMTDPTPGPMVMGGELDEDVEPQGPVWNDWSARIIARDGSPFDGAINFGVKPDAADSYDIRYDWPMPAFPAQAGQNLHMYYEQADWLPNVPEVDQFQADTRAPFEQGQTKVWDFTLEADGNITLFWPNLDGLLPAGYTAELVDAAGATTIDMLEVGEYSVTVAGSRDLEIRVTAGATDAPEDGAATALPSSPTLEPVYPNPFNPTATVAYSLPASADVTVSVFDVLGRQVATLVNSRKAEGRHQAVWNAAGESAGVYFIQLRAAGVTQIQKAVLVK